MFFGGAAGGGKSDWLLMGALEHTNVPGYSAIIFRRTFTDLALPGAIMDRALTWLAPFTDTGEVHWSDQKKRFTFPSGATLQFAYLDHDNDRFRYQSAEFQYVGFDELTQFSETQYTYLFSRLRRPSEGPLSLVPLRMRAASNPGGIGHGWVLKRFPIDGKPRGHRVFIPAKIADNPHLDADGYRASLAHLGETTRRQLEEGDWDAAEGLAFTDFRDSIHVVPDLPIPKEWDRFESMDFGVSNPTCVLMWAVDYDGNCIIFDSYYQGDTLVSKHAANIKELRAGWWPKDEDGWPLHSIRCYADPSMWARNGTETKWGEPASDVTEFREHGVDGLKQANNKRRPGRIRVAELLRPDPDRPFPRWHDRYGEKGSPRLFVVGDRCVELVEQIKVAPLLPIDSGREGAGEIVDPDWESKHGHATAALRYGAMSRPGASEEPEPEETDPRKAAALKLRNRLANRRTDEDGESWAGGGYTTALEDI